VRADPKPVTAGSGPRRPVGLGIALATGVVAAVVAAGSTAGGHAADPAPVASARVFEALDLIPIEPPAPIEPGVRDTPALRATEVRLPTLGIDSTLVDLDVGADGVLQPPGDPNVAGWYRRGAVPGEQGPAVIAGHVDSQEGPAVFFRLDGLAPGDPVEVARSDGKAFDYRVVSVESHAKAAFPTALVYGPAPGPVLRLVTCGGVFDPRSRHYRDNVVVTAVPAL
jgi:sortase family protein